MLATHKLKDELQDVPLVVHRDGKLIKYITGNQHVDRLPVLVNGTGQLLCVAQLHSGRGNEQANTILSALKDINDHGSGSISPGADSAEVEPFKSSGKDNLTAFFNDVLHDKNFCLRDNYGELIELSQIFLHKVFVC